MLTPGQDNPPPQDRTEPNVIDAGLTKAGDWSPVLALLVAGILLALIFPQLANYLQQNSNQPLDRSAPDLLANIYTVFSRTMLATLLIALIFAGAILFRRTPAKQGILFTTQEFPWGIHLPTSSLLLLASHAALFYVTLNQNPDQGFWVGAGHYLGVFLCYALVGFFLLFSKRILIIPDSQTIEFAWGRPLSFTTKRIPFSDISGIGFERTLNAGRTAHVSILLARREHGSITLWQGMTPKEAAYLGRLLGERTKWPLLKDWSHVPPKEN